MPDITKYESLKHILTFKKLLDKNQRSYWGEGGRKKTSDQKFAAGRGLWCEPFKQIQQG